MGALVRLPMLFVRSLTSPPPLCLQLAKLLMQTSDPVPFLKRRIQSGGIINLDRLIRRVLKVCPRNGGKCAV